MKEGWTYRKLGDVCDIICGQDYKAVQDDKGPFPIYGTGGIMGYASQSRCPAYSVIIGRKGSINNPLFVEQPFWNVDTAFGVVPNQTQIQPKFFYYFCKDYDFTKHDVSVTIPSLRRTDLLKIQVPLPSLAEQERIVAELDLLQGIIDKQKAQLKELDTLAQSIFYDMFGDPVKNEKGWALECVRDFAEITDYVANGSFATLRENVQYSENEDYAILVRMVDNSNRFDKSKFVYVTKSSYEFLEKSRLWGGEIIMNNVGARLGLSFICPNLGKPMTLGPNSIVIKTKCNVFNQKMFSLQASIDYIRSISGNTAMPKFNKTEFKKLHFIQPPLSLQQSFATKIEAIERQKASINASIAETQKLFDYTMDKYFG